MDLDLDSGPLGLGTGPGGLGRWTWDLQEQKDAVGPFSGDSSFPVSKVGRAVGGTWDM